MKTSDMIELFTAFALYMTSLAFILLATSIVVKVLQR